MEGEICNLPEIVRLARLYGARILVDDAHAIGVLGEKGRGTAEYFGLTDQVDLIMNTFSKTLASLGGCVVGPESVIQYIKHTARPFIFSASIPPAQVAAAAEALRILDQEPERVRRLNQIASQMKKRLSALPHVTIHESGNNLVPIIPILTGNEINTLIAAKELLDQGVYVNPVFPPAVPQDSCLLRTSYTATHTDEQLEQALAIIDRVFSSLADQASPR